MASANHIIVRDGAWIVISSPPIMEATMFMVIIIGNSLYMWNAGSRGYANLCISTEFYALRDMQVRKGRCQSILS